MNSFELVRSDNSGADVEHLTVKIDGKDVGMLYLTEDEKLSLIKLLKFGSNESGVEVIEPEWVDNDFELDDEED